MFCVVLYILYRKCWKKIKNYKQKKKRVGELRLYNNLDYIITFTYPCQI